MKTKYLKSKDRLRIFLVLAAIIFTLILFLSYKNTARENITENLPQEMEKSTALSSSKNFDVKTRTYTNQAVTGFDKIKRTFSVYLPEDWKIEKEITDSDMYVVFAKNDSKIIISEYYEGFRCVFPEYEETGDSGYAGLDQHKYIKTNFGEYRIGKVANSNSQLVNYYFCRQDSETDPFTNSPWSLGTKVGSITFIMNPREGNSLNDVQEMEDIIKSINIYDVVE